MDEMDDVPLQQQPKKPRSLRRRSSKKTAKLARTLSKMKKPMPWSKGYAAKMESLKHSREHKQLVSSTNAMDRLTTKSAKRTVDTDTVAMLFAANEDEKSEQVISAFKKQLPEEQDEVDMQEVSELLKQSEDEKLTEAEKTLAEEIVNGQIHEQLLRKENYCEVLMFIIFYAAYLFVVYSANASPKMAFEIQNAMEAVNAPYSVRSFELCRGLFCWRCCRYR